MSNGLSATAAGCGSLGANASCTLTVTGTTYNGTGAGNVVVNYTDRTITQSQSFPITVNYTPKPVITPSLTVTRAPTGNITMLKGGPVVPLTLTLTNTTTVANSLSSTDDGDVSISAATLLTAVDGNVGYTAGTGGTCVVDGSGNIKLSNASGSNSCTYVINATVLTGATVGASLASTANGSYTYVDYTNTPNVVIPPLTNKSSGNTASANLFSVSYTIAQAKSVIVIASVPVAGSESGFLNAQQNSTPNPRSVTYSVQNVGNIPPGFTVTPNVSCSNLAQNGSCNVVVTMSTANLITASNFNAIQLTAPATDPVN